jgi:hypothetical protein
MIFSPFFRLGSYPSLIFKPSTYKHLLNFYMAMIPTFVLSSMRAILYFMLPITTSNKSHEHMYQSFLGKVEERGIKFEIEGKEEYPHYY